jgi:hypothetical protein
MVCVPFFFSPLILLKLFLFVFIILFFDSFPDNGAGRFSDNLSWSAWFEINIVQRSTSLSTSLSFLLFIYILFIYILAFIDL